MRSRGHCGERLSIVFVLHGHCLIDLSYIQVSLISGIKSVQCSVMPDCAVGQCPVSSPAMPGQSNGSFPAYVGYGGWLDVGWG